MRVKKLFFVALVYNALLAALEARVLTECELDKLTAFVVLRCRALLGGKACSKEGNKNTPLPNHEVLKRVGCLPVHLELRLRRLNWFKNILRDPQAAGGLVAAWFAVFEWDTGGVLPWTTQLAADCGHTNPACAR